MNHLIKTMWKYYPTDRRKTLYDNIDTYKILKITYRCHWPKYSLTTIIRLSLNFDQNTIQIIFGSRVLTHATIMQRKDPHQPYLLKGSDLIQLYLLNVEDQTPRVITLNHLSLRRFIFLGSKFWCLFARAIAKYHI